MTTPYHNKALPAGFVLREWRLEQILGAGGFGIVYKGTGVYFGETVAIKEYFPSAISDRQDGVTVAPHDSSSEEIYSLGLKKFLEEAKVLWNLSRPERHPNIVSVRSLFEIHGTAYMVMDFESGVSLSQMLKNGHRFDETSLMAIVRPIALGLDRSHKAGVLHRDIKPANILVDDTGRPVLIDFGSARFESGDATSTKVTFYTPPYAALEQYVRTYQQGPWTDIYALGVVLYQCVTGQKPAEVLERLHGDPGEPLSAREWPGYSRAFTRAVDTAMGLRPAERPQSIDAWLALFDADEAVFDTEATQIASAATLAELTRAATVEPAPAASAPPAATPPAPPPAAAESAQVRESTAGEDAAIPAPAPRSKGMMVAAGVGVVALLAGAAALLMRPAAESAHAPASVSEAPATQGAAAAGAGAASSLQMLPQIAAFIDTARNLGRPRSELAGLVAAQAKLTDLNRKAEGLGGDPAAAAIRAEMDKIALEAAQGQRAALARAGDRRWRSLDADLKWMSAERASGALAPAGGDEKAAVAAAQKTKRAFENAVATAGAAVDGASAIQLISGVQSLYGQAMTAFDRAGDFYLPARKQGLIGEVAAVRQLAGQVATLAAGKKPGLLASRARKDAYTLLQENGARAQAALAGVDQVNASLGAATAREELDAAAAKLADAKSNIAKILASSTEAAGIQ